MNVKQAVPFFAVSDIDASLRFYIEGLGFSMKYNWMDEGKLRWCWLEIGGAALMLQQFKKMPEGKVGAGVSINFVCEDALQIYHDALEHGVKAKRPFVGNGMWVTEMADPDGYKLFFESKTDVPEETVWSDGL